MYTQQIIFGLDYPHKDYFFLWYTYDMWKLI